MHIVRSVRGKRTLFFAGYRPKSKTPRFTPKAEDAEYLSLSSANLVRDNLSDIGTRVNVLSVKDKVDEVKIDQIVSSPTEWTFKELKEALS